MLRRCRPGWAGPADSRVVQRTQEIGCGLDLGIAHAVANEEKHVFGGFDGGAGGGEGLNLGQGRIAGLWTAWQKRLGVD